MLVHICGALIRRPENNVNIWNLLWLPRRVIICAEQTGTCISTFPNALTSKKSQSHEISIILLIVAHHHNSEIQNALISKPSALLSFKIADRYKFTASYA